ncbi:hypothetical protein AMECASPLE_015887 [Ameca splendens]|uniref:Ig-like domain-containing protein n=1 Tax=Ameca splendens TaxID=208324 RepID=A0ABV1A8F9_9TELE
MTKLHRVYRQTTVDVNFIPQTSRTYTRTSGFVCLVASVLCCFPVSGDVAPKRIVGYVNQTISLPCRTNRKSELLTVEWSKEGITPNITLLYRHGSETVEEKNPAFLNRTRLTLNGGEDGNISQTIFKLQRSDEGRYQCRTWVGKQLQVEATLELLVGAVSEPELTFVPHSANGGVTLECTAEGWYPAPEITLHDEEGNEMEDEEPRISWDSAGYYTVTRRGSLQTATNRVTCSVHQPLLNQRRNKEMYILDNCMASCKYSNIASVLVTMVASALCCLTVFLFWKKYGCSFQSKESPLPQQEINPSTVHWDQAGHVRYTELQQENNVLRSHISEKDEMISKLKAEIEEHKSKYTSTQQQDQPTTDPRSSLNGSQQVNQPLDYSSTPPAATGTSHNPKSDKLSKTKGSKSAVSKQHLTPVPLKKDKSTPAPFTNNGVASSSSSSASTSKEKNILRSSSFSGLRPSNVKSPRRHTMSNNPFSVLAELQEESEYLISEKINQKH